MLKIEEQHVHCKRSRHDATLINPASPAHYLLNTERKCIEGTDGKVSRWTYGKKDTKKQNKVILMVGETGSGKTTIINTMINYLLGVKFEDQEFYQITEEKEEEENEEKESNQTESQTSEVTVYEMFVEENPTSLTIIDTPGFGHTGGYEKDEEISENLIRLFSEKDGIHYLDAVCFVMKASQNRLSGKEHYIFHSVLSLFGRDIENNIVFLLTHSDGGRPKNALNAINAAEIPCRRDERGNPVYFLFNNRQKEDRDDEDEHVNRSSWEMGERSMNEFFKLLEEKNRKSVEMTLDVLKERSRLEACVSNLMGRIDENELKTKELNQIQNALKENREKIQKCENFQFTVKKSVKEKVFIENVVWHNNATCCSVCQENCHEWGCLWAKNPSVCWVMKDDHCTVCSGKCHYSKHIRENKKYVMKTEDVIMTFDKLKQEFERTGNQNVGSFDEKIFQNTKNEHETTKKVSENTTRIEEKLNRDLKKITNEKSNLLHEAYTIILILSKIALKADSAFTLKHLDFLIQKMEEEGKDECMKNLEDLRKAGEKQTNKGALRHVLEIGGQKFCWAKNKIFSNFTGKNQ